MKVIAALFSAALSAISLMASNPVVAVEPANSTPTRTLAAPPTGQSDAVSLPATSPPPRNEIGFLTAEALAARCQDGTFADINYCFAYIASVHDTMRAYEIWLGQKEFCVPGENRHGDLRRAFLTYLSANPQNGTGQAASVVVVALKKSYPCPDSPRSDGMMPTLKNQAPSVAPKQ